MALNKERMIKHCLQVIEKYKLVAGLPQNEIPIIIFILTFDVVRLVVIAAVFVKPVIVCHKALLTGIKLNVVESA